MSPTLTLWNGLSSTELVEIEALTRPLDFEDGTELFHQGQPTTGMMVVRRGAVQLLLELPGGEQARLCRVEPGQFLGELALLDDSPRSATAVAIGDVEVGLLERQDFQGLRHARRPSSFRVMCTLARHMARLIQSTDVRSRDAFYGKASAVEDQPPLGAQEQPGGAFDPRPFLDRLPFFQSFSPTDQSALLELGTLWRLPRGRVLNSEEGGSSSMFLVVRGAVEVVDRTSTARLALVGPGGMVGQLSTLLAGPPTATYRMREHGTVLELAPAVLERLLHPTDHLSYRFLDALCARLLADITRANQVLTRVEGSRRRSDGTR